MREIVIKELIDEYIKNSVKYITKNEVMAYYNNFLEPSDIKHIKEDIFLMQI